MEAMETRILARLGDRRPLCADALPRTLRHERGRTTNPSAPGSVRRPPAREAPSEPVRSPARLVRPGGRPPSATIIEDALDGAGANADFTPQERAILKNVLGLHDVRVRRHHGAARRHVIGLAIDASLSEVLALFRTAGHSRLPVYGETLDDPRGMVHIRDFVDYLAAEPQLRPRRGSAERRSLARRAEAPIAGLRHAICRCRRAPTSCGRCCSRRPRCRRSIFW